MNDRTPITWKTLPPETEEYWPESDSPELEHWCLLDESGSPTVEIPCPVPSRIDCWLATDLHEFSIQILRAVESRLRGESELEIESETLNETLVFRFPKQLPPFVKAAFDLFWCSDRKLARYDSTDGLSVRKELAWDSPLLELTLEDAYFYGQLNGLLNSDAAAIGLHKIEKDRELANRNKKHVERGAIIEAFQQHRKEFDGPRQKTKLWETVAESLGISRRTLDKKVESLRIKVSELKG